MPPTTTLVEAKATAQMYQGTPQASATGGGAAGVSEPRLVVLSAIAVVLTVVSPASLVPLPMGHLHPCQSTSLQTPMEPLGPSASSVWSIDGNQPVDQVTTLRDAQYRSNASQVALTMLFVTFALFALGMAAIGIYGVMSYSVSQRRPEIGIRMALGAESSTVRRMVVKQGFIVVTIGIALGLPLALVLGRMMAATLFGVSTTDPVVFGGVPLVLAVVAFVATYLPALRATRRDPMRALRSE